MSTKFGTIVFLPGRGPATEDARALLKLRGVETVDATDEFAARFQGVHRPSIIIAGTVHEGISGISRAINFDLRF